MEDRARVAAMVRQQREAKGMTIEEAVASIQPDRALELVLGSYWHDLERGKPVPESCLTHIARALKLDPATLHAAMEVRGAG